MVPGEADVLEQTPCRCADGRLAVVLLDDAREREGERERKERKREREREKAK